MKITISKENYLKAIAEAASEGETVIAATLAGWRKVSAPAVTMAIRRLKRDGLIMECFKMLEDAKKFATRKVSSDNLALSEDVLAQLNVTTSDVGVGALRNDGKISWPIGLQETLTPEQRKHFEELRLLEKGATHSAA